MAQTYTLLGTLLKPSAKPKNESLDTVASLSVDQTTITIVLVSIETFLFLALSILSCLTCLRYICNSKRRRKIFRRKTRNQPSSPLKESTTDETQQTNIVSSPSTEDGEDDNLDEEETAILANYSASSRKHLNSYTVTLLACLSLFGITRTLQCGFFPTLWYAKNENNTFIDDLFGGEDDANRWMNRILWFLYIIGLAPYFSMFSSIVFQWAEVVKQSLHNVNGFIEVGKTRYKMRYMITNAVVYLILLLCGGTYLIPDNDKLKLLVIILRAVAVVTVAVLSWGTSMTMFYFGFKIRQVLKKQWVMQVDQAMFNGLIVEQNAKSVLYQPKLHNRYTSQRDRNYVLNWMMIITLFLGALSTAHFALSVYFMTQPDTALWIRLMFWAICELIPTYTILLFFWKKSNHERIMNVLNTVQYGTLLNSG